MKKLAIAIGLLLLSSVAFAGESPEVTDHAEVDAAVSAQAEVAVPEDAAVSAEAEVAVPEAAEIELPSDDPVFLAGSCSATADCWDGSTASCSSSVGPCDFADSSCPGEHGWATCGWNEDHCPPCPCPPPASKCIENRSCTNPCGSECGPGTCVNGSCNCFI